MFRKIDKVWFHVLQIFHRWTIRQACAHCQREKQRRFRRLLAWQKSALN